MVVAMNPGARSAQRAAEHGSDAAPHFIFSAGHLGSLCARRLRQDWGLFSQQTKDSCGQLKDGFFQQALELHREFLRTKCGIMSLGGKGEMHLGGPST